MDKIKLLIIISSTLLNICCTKIVRLDGEEFMIVKNYRIKILKGDWLTKRIYVTFGDVHYVNLKNTCEIRIYSSKLKDKELSLDTLVANHIFSFGPLQWESMSPTKELREINGKQGVEITIQHITGKMKYFGYIENNYIYFFDYFCNIFEFEENMPYFYEVIKSFEKIE